MTDEKTFTSLLTKLFKQNGCGALLNARVSNSFFLLTERLLSENEKYNLTAITEPDKIILNHYVDSAIPAAKLKSGARLIDVGCGAGFPTLPLAILRGDLHILAIDSTAKRVGYVAETAKLLGLDNVHTATMRAEDGARLPEYRESFDYATARAVANMRVLSELCLPYVKLGGEFIAMKGRCAEQELREARKAIALLGGGAVRLEANALTDGAEIAEHPLIFVTKKSKTPSAYPRPYAQISKKPL